MPQLKGSLQAEMIAATRPYDRIAYRVAPNLGALLATLAEGHPVLVLQNLGVDSVPFWHYAVAIGYDAARNEVLLRSGIERRARVSAEPRVATAAGLLHEIVAFDADSDHVPPRQPAAPARAGDPSRVQLGATRREHHHARQTPHETLVSGARPRVQGL